MFVGKPCEYLDAMSADTEVEEKGALLGRVIPSMINSPELEEEHRKVD